MGKGCGTSDRAKTEQVQIALSVQAAEEWEQLWEDRDNFPNLRYVAVGDENTRESHRALSGIVKPIGDPFWDTYYPPIAYRCRCTVRQESGEVAITQNLPKNLPKIDKGLGHNPGKSGKIFDLKHPYFENASQKILKSVAQYASYDKEYKRAYLSVETGGFLVQHKQAHKDDLKENLKVGKILAKHSYKAEITKHTQNDGEQPEFVINGNKSDLKTPETNKASNLLYNAIKKAREKQNLDECIVLLTEEKLNAMELFEGLKKGFRNKKSFKKVIIIKGSKAAAIIRSDIKNNEAIKKLYRLTK